MNFKNHLLPFLLTLSLNFNFTQAQNKFDTPYGNNKSVGKYAKINGIKMYYEVYGEGEPLLIIHSCNTDITAMEYQIDYFKDKYKVIAADSRGQGKSELNTKSLSYKQMTKDLEGLVKHLKLKDINILGWSDGGIIALKMGINNNVKIKKIIAMSANLRPDTTAINTWAHEQVKEMRLETLRMIKSGDTTRDWKKEALFDNLLRNQPNISHIELKKITSPTLIMVGDRDIIKKEHAVEIYENIAKSQLCIMPGTNNGAPRNNSIIFNNIAALFLAKAFDYSIIEETE